eukprot:367482-Amphidinium_carterae.1
MQQPTESDWADLKRVGRYLHSHRCLVNVYRKQRHVHQAALAGQGHSDGGHRLRWRPREQEEHNRCGYFLRLPLPEDPKQLAHDGESLFWRSRVLRHRKGDVDGFLNEVPASRLWDHSGTLLKESMKEG